MILKECISGGPGRQYKYTLTQRGQDLMPVLTAMISWGELRSGQSL